LKPHPLKVRRLVDKPEEDQPGKKTEKEDKKSFSGESRRRRNRKKTTLVNANYPSLPVASTKIVTKILLL